MATLRRPAVSADPDKVRATRWLLQTLAAIAAGRATDRYPDHMYRQSPGGVSPWSVQAVRQRSVSIRRRSDPAAFEAAWAELEPEDRMALNRDGAFSPPLGRARRYFIPVPGGWIEPVSGDHITGDGLERYALATQAGQEPPADVLVSSTITTRAGRKKPQLVFGQAIPAALLPPPTEKPKKPKKSTKHERPA